MVDTIKRYAANASAHDSGVAGGAPAHAEVARFYRGAVAQVSIPHALAAEFEIARDATLAIDSRRDSRYGSHTVS